MTYFVGGAVISLSLVDKVTDYENSLTVSEREFYGIGQTNNKQLFVMRNNKHKVIAETFLYQEYKQKNGNTFVSFHPKEIGFVEFDISKRSKNIHISYIKVHPEFQGLGIGKELLAYVESYGKEKGCKTATLDCLSAYTDGVSTLVFRKEKGQNDTLRRMRERGKVVDKNMKFYIGAQYHKQNNRKPQNDYLTPMIKNKLCYRMAKVKSLLSQIHFRLARHAFKTIKLSQKDFVFLHKVFSTNKMLEPTRIKGKQL